MSDTNDTTALLLLFVFCSPLIVALIIYLIRRQWRQRLQKRMSQQQAAAPTPTGTQQEEQQREPVMKVTFLALLLWYIMETINRQRIRRQLRHIPEWRKHRFPKEYYPQSVDVPTPEEMDSTQVDDTPDPDPVSSPSQKITLIGETGQHQTDTIKIVEPVVVPAAVQVPFKELAKVNKRQFCEEVTQLYIALLERQKEILAQDPAGKLTRDPLITEGILKMGQWKYLFSNEGILRQAGFMINHPSGQGFVLLADLERLSIFLQNDQP